MALHLPIGRHLLIEYYGCQPERINNHEQLETLLYDAAIKAGTKPIKSTAHQFEPHGASAMVLIEESHITIHTYPEYGYAAIDIFTCGDDAKPYEAHLFLHKTLKPQYCLINDVYRGVGK